MKYAAPDDEAEILPNLLGLISLSAIQQAETEGFLLAERDLLNELRIDQAFDSDYIRSIHRRALGKVYGFAGEYRTVNLSKGGFTFPAARFLPQSMGQLEQEILVHLPHIWPDTQALLDDVARVHAELLFIHPFREGNGRTARVLANMMAYKSGSASFLWEKLAEPELFAAYVRAVQAAGTMNYEPMRQVITRVWPIS